MIGPGIASGTIGVSAEVVGTRCGKKIVGDIITGYTKHGINQAISRDGGRGVAAREILKALKNPESIIETVDKMGRKAIEYSNGTAKVVVNPETRKIITVIGGARV